MEYAALKGEPGANVTLQDLGFQTDFSVYLQIRQTWLAFSQYTAQIFHLLTCKINLKWGRLYDLPSLPLLSLSDYPGHRGCHHHPPAHLPQEKDSHCHCSHQRSQQVRLHINDALEVTKNIFQSTWMCLTTRDAVVVFTEPLGTWCVPFSTHSSPSSSWP